MPSGEKVHHFKTSFSDVRSLTANIQGIKKQSADNSGN